MKKALAFMLAMLMLLAMGAAAFADDVTEPDAPAADYDVPETPSVPQMPAMQFEPGVAFDPSMLFDPNSPYYNPDLIYDPDMVYDPSLGYEQFLPQEPQGWYYGETGIEGNLMPEPQNPDLTPEERREENTSRRDELNDVLNAVAGAGGEANPSGEGIDELLIDQIEFNANAMRSLRIKSSIKPGSVVEIGQEAVLTAIPMGFGNVAYNLQWQWAKVDEDGNIGKYHNIEGANGLTLTIRFDEDNIDNVWRAVIQEVS